MSGEQPELRSAGFSSFPWNINHHLIERCEGFDSQPMTPPSDLILKEPPKIKPRRSKYWSFLGEQEKIPETSEVKNVKPTDLRTYISPQDGEEITFVHTRPMFYSPNTYSGPRSPTQDVSMDYSEMSVGNITSEVMNQRLSAGSTCTDEGMEGIQKSLASTQSDDLMAELFDDSVGADSSSDTSSFREKVPERCMSDTTLGHLSFGGLFKQNPTENTDMEISDTYRQRSFSTTDIMSQHGDGTTSNSDSSLMTRIHNRFSASTEALKQMKRNIGFGRLRHASGPEMSTTSSDVDKPESPTSDKEPEHHKVALNAVLMSS